MLHRYVSPTSDLVSNYMIPVSWYAMKRCKSFLLFIWCHEKRESCSCLFGLIIVDGDSLVFIWDNLNEGRVIYYSASSQ